MYFANTLLCCLISCEKSEWVCFNFVRNFFEIFFFHFAAWNPGLRRCWCWELWSGSCYWPAAVVAAESVLRVARRTTECTRPHGRDKVHMVTKIAKKNKKKPKQCTERWLPSDIARVNIFWAAISGHIIEAQLSFFTKWRILNEFNVWPMSTLCHYCDMCKSIT